MFCISSRDATTLRCCLIISDSPDVKSVVSSVLI